MNEGEVIPEASAAQARERLRDYERLKLELASAIRRMLLLINAQADHERHRRCQDLLAQLAEDRFTLAVVGQFSRGKSSLMNAVLGMDRLPVGVVPLTSVITKVSYGNPERVLIEYARSFLKGEIAVAELPEYVTDTGNPGNKKQIAAAEVQLPSDFLRRGLFFVDTPGIGSVIAANTATTEQFLPEADAVIFVTSFESPLGRDELEFLRKVREHVRKVFFVVNKLDLVPLELLEEVLTFIRDRLKHEAGLPETRLFPVSALLGLKAKLSGSAQQLAESGLPALEENLVHFLTTEKTGVFLVRSCDRALSLLGELRRETVDKGESGGAWVGPYDQFMARRAGHDPGAIEGDQPVSTEDIFGCLMKLRRELAGDGSGEGRPSAAPRPPAKSRPEAELMEAVRRPCEVCSQVADAVFKFMAKFQYQIIVNENERLTFARHGGLCPLHTWQYAEVASPQGISTSYPAVLMSLNRRLNLLAESDPPGGWSAGIRSLVTGQERCRACQEQLAAQDKVIREIVDRLAAEDGQEANTLPVLCLPHLSVLLRKVPDAGLAQTLVAFEAAISERLAENMERYALKHDALRRGLQSKDELVAYHRALSQLVGDKRLQAPWHVEYLL
jgi:ribosome biogenesis GTPase A